MNEPSGMRTPCSSIEANIGCRTSTPRSCAARAHGVQCMPVTAMTLPGGRPWRTRASTPAIAAVRAGTSKSSSTHCGSRRVIQTVSATCEISSSSCTAETPAPTMITRFPANSSAET